MKEGLLCVLQSKLACHPVKMGILSWDGYPQRGPSNWAQLFRAACFDLAALRPRASTVHSFPGSAIRRRASQSMAEGCCSQQSVTAYFSSKQVLPFAFTSLQSSGWLLLNNQLSVGYHNIRSIPDSFILSSSHVPEFEFPYNYFYRPSWK